MLRVVKYVEGRKNMSKVVKICRGSKNVLESWKFT